MIVFDVYFTIDSQMPTEYKMIAEETLDEALFALNRFVAEVRAVAIVRRDRDVVEPGAQ